MKKRLSFIFLLLVASIIASVEVKADNEFIYNQENITINLTSDNVSFNTTLEPVLNSEYISCNTPYSLYDDLGSFNCHFYTFFFTVGVRFNAINNDYYWLSNSEASKFLRYGDYLASGLYSETDVYHAEIIAYYDSNDLLVHTGRVYLVNNDINISNPNDLTTVWVTSKWDNGYIYNHRADQYYNFSYVKFFSYSYNHEHNFIHFADATTINTHSITCRDKSYCQFSITAPHIETYSSNGGLTHNINCLDCGYNIASDVSHCNFTYTNVDINNHNKRCGYCDYNTLESHNFRKLNDLLFICDDCNARARYIPIIHNGIISPMNSIFNSTIINYEGSYYLLIFEGNVYE